MRTLISRRKAALRSRLRKYAQLTIPRRTPASLRCTVDDRTSANPNDKITERLPPDKRVTSSQRNFYNPELDAKLTDYVRWMGNVPGLSLINPEEFKFRFAWWGFYDGVFDYMDSEWNRARQGGGVMTRTGQRVSTPLARQSVSTRSRGGFASTTRPEPRNILAKRNRINEPTSEYTKGVLFRWGQAYSWGGRTDRLLTS